MKRVLLTGANGFVGRHVRKTLEKVGLSVYGTAGPESARTDCIAVDLRSEDRVRDLIDHVRPNVILHLAAQSSVRESWVHPADTLDVNARGTIHLWMAGASRGVEHFVYISTAEVYGASGKGALLEDSPLEPANPYATSKMTAELLLQQLQTQAPDVRLTIIRPFNHIGPGQSSEFVVPNFAHQLSLARLQKVPHISVGNLSAVRDFLDVRDVARAYALVAQSKELCGTFNLCSGVPRSIESVLQDLMRVSGLEQVDVRYDATRLRPVDVPTLVGDPTKFRHEVGWRPEIDWKRTLRDIWQEATSLEGLG